MQPSWRRCSTTSTPSSPPRRRARKCWRRDFKPARGRRGRSTAGWRAGPGLAVLSFRANVWYDGPVGLLDELYVRPDVRGRRLGSALLRAACDLVRSRGGEVIEINVDGDEPAPAGFTRPTGSPTMNPTTPSSSCTTTETCEAVEGSRRHPEAPCWPSGMTQRDAEWEEFQARAARAPRMTREGARGVHRSSPLGLGEPRDRGRAPGLPGSAAGARSGRRRGTSAARHRHRFRSRPVVDLRRGQPRPRRGS